MNEDEVTKLSGWAYCGVFLLGVVTGYIVGNSKTSVSTIVVSSLLGFMATIVSAIIEGKGDINRVYRNLNIIGKIFVCFSIGMLAGILSGSAIKGNGGKLFGNLNLPPISSDVSKP